MNIYGKNTVIEALKTRDDVSKIIISTSNHEMIPLVKKLIKNKKIIKERYEKILLKTYTKIKER